MKKILSVAVLLLTLAMLFPYSSYAWSNGGYSSDPSNPDYGTHDWIAQHALDWVPDDLDYWIRGNLPVYLYGTELPDNGAAPDGIGDTGKHHIYYRSDGTLQDDSAAVRARETYDQALAYLRAGDASNAAKWAGIMTHYIADIAVFAHVMGSRTDWGAEIHHSDYEDQVNAYTLFYSASFFTLSFDGSLAEKMSTYDAAKDLAYDTTFDVDGDLTAVWMDQHYDWGNPTFRNRVGESINLAVNYLADVLYTLHLESGPNGPDHVIINEAELNPPGTDTGNEWVELYNPTASAVNIGGWKISTFAGNRVTVTIATGTSIPAGGYYVVTYSGQWLDNKNEYLTLQDSAGVIVANSTILMSDEADDERTWQRYPDGGGIWVFEPSTRHAVNIPEFPVAALISAIAILLAIGVLRVRLHKRKREKFTAAA